MNPSPLWGLGRATSRPVAGFTSTHPFFLVAPFIFPKWAVRELIQQTAEFMADHWNRTLGPGFSVFTTLVGAFPGNTRDFAKQFLFYRMFFFYFYAPGLGSNPVDEISH